MKNKHELEAVAGEFMARPRNADVIADFTHVYANIVKPVLDFAKHITGPKWDARIDQWEHSAQLICDGQHPDVANYCQVWDKFHIKQILRLLQLITGPKVDKAIDVFIQISEGFCHQPE